MKAVLVDLCKAKGGESHQGALEFTSMNGAKRAPMKIKNRGIRAQEEALKRQVLKESGVEVPKKGKKKTALTIGGTEGVPAMKAVLVDPSEILNKSRVAQPVGSHKMYNGRDFVKNPQGKWVLAQTKSAVKPGKETPPKTPAKPTVNKKPASTTNSGNPKGYKKPKVKLQVGHMKQEQGDGDTVKSNVRYLLEEYDAAEAHKLKVEKVLSSKYGTTVPLARKILGMSKKGAKP
jgi:hypothetical protein